MLNEWDEIGMKRGFTTGEVDDHELVVVEKVEETQSVFRWKAGGGAHSMHVTHHALTVASGGDGEDGGPLVPSKVETNPGEIYESQPDFTNVRLVVR